MGPVTRPGTQRGVVRAAGASESSPAWDAFWITSLDMHVIAVASQKGGVGKTTISLNLGLAIARAGTKTLLTEFDAQGSLGLSLGLQDRAKAGIAEILTGSETFDRVLQRTRETALGVLSVGRVDPATVAGFEEALTRPGAIVALLGTAKAQGFEVVLIDCPAGLGRVSTRALEVATHVLAPLQAEPLALRSVGQLLALVDRIRATKNPNLQLLGVVLSMFDRKVPASLDVAETLWTKFPEGVVMDPIIPRDEVFLEASMRGAPLQLMGKKPPPLARRFDQLASDILDRLMPSSAKVDDDAPISLLV